MFTDGAISDGNPLLRMLRPICQARALAAPSGAVLARWIKETAQEKGAGISPAAVSRLSDLVGSDLWTLDQEIEKLSLFASGRAIDERDVEELVPQVREANIFAAVDALIEGRGWGSAAVATSIAARTDGTSSYIIAMTERQLRLLALARDYLDHGTPQRGPGQPVGGVVPVRAAQDHRTGPASDPAGNRQAIPEAVGGGPGDKAGPTGALTGPGGTGGGPGSQPAVAAVPGNEN